MHFIQILLVMRTLRMGIKHLIQTKRVVLTPRLVIRHFLQTQQELFSITQKSFTDDGEGGGSKAVKSKKKASEDQKRAVANYFIAEMFLGAEMCMDRNYVAMHKMDALFPYEVCHHFAAIITVHTRSRDARSHTTPTFCRKYQTPLVPILTTSQSNTGPHHPREARRDFQHQVCRNAPSAMPTHRPRPASHIENPLSHTHIQ